METKMIWANFVSHDLQRTIQFYSDLGFKQNGKETDELVSFVFGEHNFVINFFVPSRLENALKGKLTAKNEGNEIIFSLSAKSREEVDLWYQKVKDIGGTIFAEPENFEVGYTFGFTDPDGHKFNFLFWPGM
ncbi:VOC family protein [Flavobacterium sp. H4147]|uniref:VOC family protein n=1 Tax=unclassified Flavobacterium TaxID=196869 RepID=UPI0023EB0BE5|nr:VOC family protein [Flavobacterium sp. H4147]